MSSGKCLFTVVGAKLAKCLGTMGSSYNQSDGESFASRFQESLNSCQKLSAFAGVEEWNAELLFREITQLTLDDINALCPEASIARVVLIEARRERDQAKEVKGNAYHTAPATRSRASSTAPSGPRKAPRLQYDDTPKTWVCPHCKDCSEREKCILRKNVVETSVADIAKMSGALLSSNETTDVLGYSPKVCTQLFPYIY